MVHRWFYEHENPLIGFQGPDGEGEKVESRTVRSEGAELEGENKRGEGVDGLKPMCECDGGGVGWQCGKKILMGRKVFLPHCQRTSHHPHT